MTTQARPFSTASSIISPHAALEALAAHDELNIRDFNSTPQPGDPRNTPRQSDDHNAFASSSRPHVRSNGRSHSPLIRHYASVHCDDPPNEDGLQGRDFVRAKFDFGTNDPSALSFKAGDIIEVITKLDSGWWDGMLRTTRGWFPSNFVEVVDVQVVLDEMDRIEGEGGDLIQGGLHDAKVRRTTGGLEMNHDDEPNGWRETLERPVGLGDLAAELMDADHLDEGWEFELAAQERRRRQARAHGALRLGSPVRRPSGHDPEDREERDDFGPRRRREEAEQTVRSLHPSAIPDDTPSEDREETRSVNPNDLEHAWLPTLTPDGQVYYHNTATGEDSWDLPIATPVLTANDIFAPTEETLFDSSAGPSAAFAAPPIDESPTIGQDFAPPPKSRDLPHPWEARMTDDGREWFYVNRQTGLTGRDRPIASEETVGDSKRLSVSSATRMDRMRMRRSVETRRKEVAGWAKSTREAMVASLPVRGVPFTIGAAVEGVNEALRELFEAAVAGSAAEEELYRAEDVGSASGVSAALEREEMAVNQLATVHEITLLSIRELFAVSRYVGPLDPLPELPRPDWTRDKGLIGTMGLLSANVHAALIGRPNPEGGITGWGDVLRAAGKLKDVIASFPMLVTPGVISDAANLVQGKNRETLFGVERVGELLGGRWGFGLEVKEGLRSLDSGSLSELQHVKGRFDEIGSAAEAVTNIIRTADRLKRLALGIDLASIVDVDGDIPDGVGSEDADGYVNLVIQSQNTLLDLEEAVASLDESCIALACNFDTPTYHLLASAVNATLRSITTIHLLAQNQRNMVDRHILPGQIGHRSSHHLPTPRDSLRPTSSISTTSRLSRGSTRASTRERVRGLEEESLDHVDVKGEQRDMAGEMGGPGRSASASQTSLPKRAGSAGHSASTSTSGAVPTGDRPGDVSATSSTTSLAYQQTDSDAGSNKGKRASLMKFMRGRSSVDVDDGRNSTRSKGPSKKLARLLGEEVSYIPTIPPPIGPSALLETPWYLGEDFEPNEIVYDSNGGVRAGTLRALVAKLTPHGSTDTSFFQAFLLTFRSFTSGDELLDMLTERYHVEAPDDMNQAEFLDWKKLKQTPIRLRVANTIRAWLDVHYMEAADAAILDRVEGFARGTLAANGSELLSKQLMSLVQRRRQSGEGDSQRRIVSGGMLSPPAPLQPRVPSGREMRLQDVNPIEFARQLTILEFGHFQKIKPIECLHKAWNTEDPAVAPNVKAVIKTANILSGWVSLSILNAKDMKGRAAMFKYWLQTAYELKMLNNFSSMAAIGAGLSTAPILRLNRTKELLNEKSGRIKVDLEDMLDSTKNFQKYKEMLKAVNPPCVPFFGFWLSALTFIEDGNKDFFVPGPGKAGMSNSVSGSSPASSSRGYGPQSATVSSHSNGHTPTSHTAPSGPMINFFKRSLCAECLRDIQQYQFQPYNLAKYRPVSDWMMKQMEICDRTFDLEAVWELSMTVEPREKDEDKITRMLHDSGFI